MSESQVAVTSHNSQGKHRENVFVTPQGNHLENVFLTPRGKAESVSYGVKSAVESSCRVQSTTARGKAESVSYGVNSAVESSG